MSGIVDSATTDAVEAPPPRVLVAGIGHVLLGDDAIGPSCVEALKARYELPPFVELADLGSPGLDLVLHLAAADIVLVVDALRGVEPGSVHVIDLSGRAAAPAAGSASRAIARLDTHGLALEQAVLTARLSGDRPRLVRIIGLGGASFELGLGLSAIARARLDALSARVIDELAALGYPCRLRHPA